MNPAEWLPFLLGIAVLLPLASFATILTIGRLMRQPAAAQLATTMIVGSLVCSLAALGIWAVHHYPAGADHASVTTHETTHETAGNAGKETETVYTGQWYRLATFGRLQLSIDYYIDALTVCMFCMVTLISSCIHFYSMGYMHEELHEVTDHEVMARDGSRLRRAGRCHRFFQYLSLFCFSMLGVVVSGNLLMTFVFWELVGICSYFLIGFYIERRSASNAANKAFIVNRVGDFGMLVGLMAIWASLGTFAFGDAGGQAGIFHQIRPGAEQHPGGAAHAREVVPEGMVRLAARERIAGIVRQFPPSARGHDRGGGPKADRPVARRPGARLASPLGLWAADHRRVGDLLRLRRQEAQFPLHTWLPDAMEGPTPVSALVHSATMVAAGVFLVARCYPVFTPEALLVIAVVGCITLLMAATIAVAATDIKRVLAYSTVSQLGYMMLALGLGGWLAGVLHLFTHAFFKSLLFLGSGCVIHATHTNEMPLMGGLWKKMPWTAFTMLVGCLAIIGAGIPLVIGLSGYYSKDAILEQAMAFKQANPAWGPFFFYAAAAGSAITAFYIFRMWYLTFCGRPRDAHRHEHATSAADHVRAAGDSGGVRDRRGLAADQPEPEQSAGAGASGRHGRRDPGRAGGHGLAERARNSRCRQPCVDCGPRHADCLRGGAGRIPAGQRLLPLAYSAARGGQRSVPAHPPVFAKQMVV